VTDRCAYCGQWPDTKRPCSECPKPGPPVWNEALRVYERTVATQQPRPDRLALVTIYVALVAAGYRNGSAPIDRVNEIGRALGYPPVMSGQDMAECFLAPVAELLRMVEGRA
jgi:hypothetical protein